MKRLCRALEQKMLDLLSFFSEGYSWVADGQRFLERLEWVTLQGLSDALIALTCYAITLILLYLGRRRPDLPLSGLVLGSGVMASCGTTHLAEVWAVWHPNTGLVEVSKLVTAAIALATTVLLVKRLPALSTFSDIAPLQLVNQTMQQSMAAQAQIEAELILSRDLQDSIFNESADALFLVDAQTLLTLDCNRRAVDLFQAADKAQLIGIEGHTLQRYSFSQDDLDAITAEMQAKGVWSRELEYVTYHGDYFWGDIAATPITVAGQVMNLVRVTDITERKQAKDQMRSLNDRLQYLLSHAPVVIFSCKPEGDHGATWVSENVRTIFGYESQDFLDDAEFWINRVHPEDRDRVLNKVTQLVDAEHDVYEYRFLHRDGHYRWVYDRTQLMRDEAGDPIEILGYMIDISARKQTEIALKASEQQLSTLISNLPGYVYRVFNDANYTPIYVSQGVASITGYSPDDYLVARTISCAQTLHPDDATMLWDTVQTAVRDRQAYQCEYRIITKTGEQKWVWGRGQGIYAEDGSLQWLEGFVTDISQRKRSEAKRKQAEAALQESESRFQSLVTNMPGMVYRYLPYAEASGTFTYVSPGAYALVELDPAQILQDANSFWRLIHPEDLPSLHASMAISVGNCDDWRWEGRLITPSGQLKWVQGNARPQETPEGVVWDGLMTDITDRKLAAIALQESEERFREIANTIPQMFFVRATNPDRFVYVSPAYEKIWGRSLDELFQTPWVWMEDIHPDDRALVSASVASQLQGNSVRREYRIVRPDGSLRWISAQVTAIHDAEGQPLRFIGLAEDITVRKQSETALQESEARYRTLAEVSPVGIFRFDRPLNCVYVNARWSEMTGRTRESAMGSGWIEALHPEERVPLLAHWASRYAQAHSNNFIIEQGEGRHLRPDGSIGWYYIQVAQETDSSGQGIGYVGTLTDITERKAGELALNQEILRRKMLFDASIDGVVVLDQTGNVIEANASFAKMLGYSLEDVTTLNVVDFDAHWAQQELKSKIDKSDFCSNGFETRHRRKDGSIYDVEISANSVDWDGQSVQFCICRDVSDRKKIEAALRQSEAKNRAMLAAIPDLLLRVRRDGTCLDFIPPPSPEDGTFLTLRQNIAEILPDDLLQHQLQRIGQALATGELQVWEHQFLKYDKLCAEEVRVSPCGADEALVIVRDVSERKQAEEALRRYERIVSSTTDVVVLLDRNYIYQVVNQAYLHLYNKSQAEIVGHPIWEVISLTLFETIKPKIDQCLTGQVVQFEMWIDYPTLGLQFMSVTYNPYFDTNQTPSGVVVILHNITKLKQTEMELELQSVIVNNMAEGVCVAKIADGTIVYANPKFEQMFGYDTGELKGKHTSILNYEDETTNARAVYQTIATHVLQNGSARYEVHSLKKDGTSFWCRGNTSVLHDSKYGAVMVAVQQDITEQKQAEEQIKASLKEKEVLLKEIHHRVKNNLGVVDGLLKMQSRRSRSFEVIEALQESQNRIASIALVHEKLYSSEHLANIDFAQYIHDLTAHLFDCYNIYANRVTLIVEIADIPLDIDTAIPCGLIINELVSNALKYAFLTARAGEVRVAFGQYPDQSVFLMVQDNGIGLPADFDIKQAKTLGISLIKGLVKQLRGTLEVRTQPGTMFLISFKLP